MFGGARCYIGTVFSVVAAEAEEVVSALFGRHLGMELSTALSRTQASVYGGLRRPYVMVGCHFQRIRKRTREAPLPFVRRELREARDHWRTQIADPRSSADERARAQSIVDFLQSELQILDDAENRDAFRHS
jgi:hypothetical protein